VLGITHLTKGTAGKDPTERVTGSLAFGAVARIVMLAARKQADEDGGPPRIFTRSKSNIGPSGGGFGYDIVASPLYDRPDIIATRTPGMTHSREPQRNCWRPPKRMTAMRTRAPRKCRPKGSLNPCSRAANGRKRKSKRRPN
jgi:hypothetical protein